MSKILLETVNLKKTYDHKNGTINLFDNVNIKIKRGDINNMAIREVIFTFWIGFSLKKNTI